MTLVTMEEGSGQFLAEVAVEIAEQFDALGARWGKGAGQGNGEG